MSDILQQLMIPSLSITIDFYFPAYAIPDLLGHVLTFGTHVCHVVSVTLCQSVTSSVFHTLHTDFLP